MMKYPLITSLLDTDLYKFTMMQCILHHFKEAEVSYRFFSRKPLDLLACSKEIEKEIAHLSYLRFTKDELAYLSTLPYLKKDFINYLSTFGFNKNFIDIAIHNNEFTLTVQGPWVDTILFEVPLLAIISECFYRHHYPSMDLKEARARLETKIELVKSKGSQLRFSDFGTRRRFSKAWQEEMLIRLKEALPTQFIGTSNVFFAKKLNLEPIGTMAHEFLQACQVLAPSLTTSQQYALNVWLQEYPQHLGIALTDVLTMDLFLKEFDADLTKRYQGLRQDSGDPILWGEKALAHYAAHNIDARTKTFVFSDGLTIAKAIQIFEHFKEKANVVFGIGTNLTNDTGLDPLDIVIKMTQTNHKPVVKISDSKGKIICDDDQYLSTIKTLFNLRD